MSDNTFYNIIFPTEISYGATCSSKFSTDITSTQSGYEQRIANWQYSLQTFDVSHKVKTIEEITLLKKLFLQVMGPKGTFKFKDWSDYTVSESEGVLNKNQVLTGLKTAQLYKNYSFSSDYDGYYRQINYIADDSVVDYFSFILYDDLKNIIDSSLYNLDRNTGTISFNSTSTITVSSAKSATLNSINYYQLTTATPHLKKLNDYVCIEKSGLSISSNSYQVISVIDDNNIIINLQVTDSITTDSLTSSILQTYPANQKLTYQCEFYVKVRFSEDTSSISIDDFNSYSLPCNLSEVR